jgi:hypothetical protein
MQIPAKSSSRAPRHLGLLVAVMALPGAGLASPVFAQGHPGGGGGHAFSGGHMSAPHFSGGGHAMSAPHFAASPHFAAAPHYAAGPNYGGYNGGYRAPAAVAGGYHAQANYGHAYNTGQQVANNGGHSNFAPNRGYVAPGHGFASARLAPGRFVPGAPFRYGRWNGGYWRGGFWPRVWWGANFPWFLPVLPAIAATYWWDSIPYYYYDNVYYTYDPSASGYVVTTPPPAQDQGGADQSAAQPDPNANYSNPPPANYPAPAAGGGLYAYPKNGQSDEQQSSDRQECEQWANGQTGSDSSGNSPDYQRALTACLQGRGYSVN